MDKKGEQIAYRVCRRTYERLRKSGARHGLSPSQESRRLTIDGLENREILNMREDAQRNAEYLELVLRVVHQLQEQIANLSKYLQKMNQVLEGFRDDFNRAVKKPS